MRRPTRPSNWSNDWLPPHDAPENGHPESEPHPRPHPESEPHPNCIKFPGWGAGNLMQLTSRRVGEDGVALVRLERGESRNAINTRMLVEMLEHLAVARAEQAVRVLVISSSDHLGLSAGADVREKLDEEGQVRRMQLFADLYDAIVAFPKPTIAACHGDVVGGGAEIAIACDMRVGGANLRMRFPGAALGVPVGPARLVSLCGLAAAKYLLLSSRTIGADEALRLGLVNRVAPAAATEASALELAAGVAAHPPEAVAQLKRMLHEWDDVVGRSKIEGVGQVEWARTGPGLPNSE
jgi:enoyl-CoA hydratase